jgi:uncharacterized phage-associated protein
MLMMGYDVGKAAHATAYFAKLAGGRINVLKLSKLLYLAEREFIQRYDEPMFFDKLASMPDGPVVSVTLNLINGNAEDKTWQETIAPRDGYDVYAVREFSVDELDELSVADLEIMDDLWKQFGAMDKYKLRDWTHKPENVPEWEDPQGSSNPIPHAKLFRLLGKKDPGLLVENMHERQRLARDLADA